jgi:serine/threonine-protein kinase
MQHKDFVQACPKLEESQRLDPGVGTLLYLAHCYEQLGRNASAWATFKEAAYAAADAGQSDRESMALERAEQLKPKLAYLTVRVLEPETEGLEVRRGSEMLRPATWGVPVPVDSGEHLIEAKAPGRKSWEQQVKVAKGPGTTEVLVPRLALEEPEPVSAPPPPPAPPQQKKPAPVVSAPQQVNPAPPPEQDAASGSPQRTWGWITLAAGGASVAAGGIFGLLAAQANAEADKQCRPNDPTLCSPEGVTLGETATNRAGVATLATGLGAALLVTGGILLFTAPSDEPSTHAALEVGAQVQPQGALLGIKGAW